MKLLLKHIEEGGTKSEICMKKGGMYTHSFIHIYVNTHIHTYNSTLFPPVGLDVEKDVYFLFFNPSEEFELLFFFN